MFVKLALRSLLDRKGSIGLTLFAMSVSIFVILGVEHIRYQSKENFSSSLSGIDLVVGSKTSDLNLLLYSVFRIGDPVNNISWRSFEKISSHPKVKWTIPISLGDSHRGYPVLGTTENYFKHYKYGKNKKLALKNGYIFKDLFDVVIGFEIAKKFDYKIGDSIIFSHGMANSSFTLHKGKPFKVVGILEITGSPVDRTLHVKLEAIEALHSQTGEIDTNTRHSDLAGKLNRQDFTPANITAFMVGLKSKISTFQMRREINNYQMEPLLAIIPGVALIELWQMMEVITVSMFVISVLVFISTSLGVSAILLSSISQRGTEIHLLRVIGAPRRFIFFLVQFETIIITTISSLLALFFLTILLSFSQSLLLSKLGIRINEFAVNNHNLGLLTIMLIASSLISLIPSIYGYKKTNKL